MSHSKVRKNIRHGRRRTPWPLILLVGGGLSLIIIAMSVLNRPSQAKIPIEVSGSPSLKVDRQKVDLGNVTLGRTVDVTFELMNVGDQTLRFSKVPYIEVVQGC